MVRKLRITVAIVIGTASTLWLLGRSGLFILASYAPPLILLGPLVLALVVTLVARQWRAAAASVVTLVALSFGEGLTLSGSAPVGPNVRVLSYNVAKWERGATAVGGAIAGTNADVVCLAEAGRYFWMRGADENPDALLRALPGYRLVGEGENAIASRLPILSTRNAPLDPGPRARPLVEAVIDTAAGEVSVVSVHLVPTLLTVEYSADRGAAAHGTVAEIAEVRLRQVEALLAHLRAIPRPVVLCGDFNAPPTAAPIRLVSRSFTDAWAARGNGFGWTESTEFPRGRIDYVFVRGLEVQSVTVVDATASDHRPVLALVGSAR